MGEQSDTCRILLRNDRKSRHRRIKKPRRYERLAATSQFLYTILLQEFPLEITVPVATMLVKHLTLQPCFHGE